MTIELELRTLRTTKPCTRWQQVGVDRGINQIAGALHARPVNQVVAAHDVPARSELIADFQRKFGHHREARLRVAAGVA